jgi:DNA-binding NarL/FixJ family response regulator
VAGTEIAEEVSLSVGSVKRITEQLRPLFGVRSNHDLLATALRLGYEPSSPEATSLPVRD